MIKEGMYLFVRGQSPVEPFKGKYAVRSTDVFERMEEQFRIPTSWSYKPLRVEFELTTKCNDRCPHCGMGALPMSKGKTLTKEQIDHIVAEFCDVGLPSVAITGGEPFVALPQMLYCMQTMRGRIDISKLTTNAFWGTERNCERVMQKLIDHGLLENRFFVPLLLLSIGEQTTPLDRVCRIIHYIVSNFAPEQIQIGVSALKHRQEVTPIEELKSTYRTMYGIFPEDRVHSTIRIYLVNERLDGQAEVPRRSTTSVTKWMHHCYDCFAPTVGAYVLPTALLKYGGDFYSCAAFNVPERLGFGNIYQERFRDILGRLNENRYVQIVRKGGGLKGLLNYIPNSMTDHVISESYCDSCNFLIDRFEKLHGPANRALATEHL